VEHVGALVLGGILLVAGARKGGPIGKLCKMGGWSLILRGQSGYRRFYRMLGIPIASVPSRIGHRGILMDTQIVIRRSASDLYRLLRNFENLPVFMDHLVSVHEIDDRHSEWVAHAPAGMVIRWDVEIIRDVEDELIAWRSMEGSGIDSAGSIRLESMGQNMTTLKVRMRYNPPADMPGAMILQLLRLDPKTSIDHDLRRFKSIVEWEAASRPKRSNGSTPKALRQIA